MLLIVLKLTSILLTGVMGIIALLVEYKDSNGHVTTWGRRALLGVLMSTFIAAASQVIESRSDAENAASSSLLLTGLRHPLLRVRISFDSVFTPSSSSVAQYMKRLDTRLAALTDDNFWQRPQARTPGVTRQGPNDEQVFGGNGLMFSDRRPVPMKVFFGKKSVLYPTPTTDAIAYRVLSDCIITVAVKKKANTHTVLDDRDVLFQPHVQFDSAEPHDGGTLEYDPERHLITHSCDNRDDKDAEISDNTGQVTSIDDLVNAQVLAYQIIGDKDPAKRAELRAVLAEGRISSL
jgi:hypothetical protein